MNRLFKFFLIRSSDNLPQLGRWRIDYTTSVLHRKIDQANEDHCGCCVVDMKEMKEMNKNEKLDLQNEEYMLPYCV